MRYIILIINHFTTAFLLGTVSARLTTRLMEEKNSIDIEEYFDVRSENLALPAVSTYYNCKYIAAPKLGAQQHVVKFSPEVDEDNTALLHHMVLRRCNMNAENFVDGKQEPCNASPDYK